MLEFKYTEGDQIVSFQTTLRGVHIDYYVEAFKCFLSAAPLETLLIRLSGEMGSFLCATQCL